MRLSHSAFSNIAYPRSGEWCIIIQLLFGELLTSIAPRFTSRAGDARRGIGIQRVQITRLSTLTLLWARVVCAWRLQVSSCWRWITSTAW
jgi:hypothetical protein